jgi:hypothetical protein
LSSAAEPDVDNPWLFEREGGIARLTLNRPNASNVALAKAQAGVVERPLECFGQQDHRRRHASSFYSRAADATYGGLTCESAGHRPMPASARRSRPVTSIGFLPHIIWCIAVSFRIAESLTQHRISA